MTAWFIGQCSPLIYTGQASVRNLEDIAALGFTEVEIFLENVREIQLAAEDMYLDLKRG